MLLKIVTLLRKLESQQLLLFFILFFFLFEGIYFLCYLLNNNFASNHGKCPPSVSMLHVLLSSRASRLAKMVVPP